MTHPFETELKRVQETERVQRAEVAMLAHLQSVREEEQRLDEAFERRSNGCPWRKSGGDCRGQIIEVMGNNEFFYEECSRHQCAFWHWLGEAS